MRYDHLLDYLGDIRADGAPAIPPGGSTGDEIADARLCLYAQSAKQHPDPVFFLREMAGHLYRGSELNDWRSKAFERVADWLEEYPRINSDECDDTKN